MDPFDEFEFKPLTEGLGFHPRAQLPEKAWGVADPTNPAVSKVVIDPPLPRRREEPQIHRSKDKGTILSAPVSLGEEAPSTVEEILKTLGERKRYDFKEDGTSLRSPSMSRAAPVLAPASAQRKEWVPSYFDFSAALLDSMLIVSIYLISIISVLFITKANFFEHLANSESNGVYEGLVGLFVTVVWGYLTVHRIFLGYTPGEWVFDQRVGIPGQISGASYCLRVALRTFIVLGTGFITIPLISMLFRRDWLGRIMGIELCKKA